MILTYLHFRILKFPLIKWSVSYRLPPITWGLSSNQPGKTCLGKPPNLIVWNLIIPTGVEVYHTPVHTMTLWELSENRVPIKPFVPTKKKRRTLKTTCKQWNHNIVSLIPIVSNENHNHHFNTHPKSNLFRLPQCFTFLGVNIATTAPRMQLGYRGFRGQGWCCHRCHPKPDVTVGS